MDFTNQPGKSWNEMTSLLGVLVRCTANHLKNAYTHRIHGTGILTVNIPVPWILWDRNPTYLSKQAPKREMVGFHDPFFIPWRVLSYMTPMILLMVQKSGLHQLRLVLYLPLFTRFEHHPRWFSRRMSETSTVLNIRIYWGS